ncbi:hypothetical protein U9M48_005147 [Paspalum notatum var. saurae]|uniref:Pentatricopeptide repeat-containing protein n=1 Tax=Paspalum notatum var. saurae TaxID=547442 RepID=A0AAQ3PW90_PASNO
MRLRRRYAALLRRASALTSLPLVASLHAAVLIRGVPALLAASLIHGYAACGDLASARALFDETPRTLSARTALAGALSAHGRCAEALNLFSGLEAAEMDDRAATVLLAACARAGMVAEGRRVFARVPRPALQHYTCMVEMLGRAGEVEEAERMVAGMEARPDRIIFAALLAACRLHGRVDVAERVAGLMRRVRGLALGSQLRLEGKLRRPWQHLTKNWHHAPFQGRRMHQIDHIHIPVSTGAVDQDQRVSAKNSAWPSLSAFLLVRHCKRARF